MSVLPMLVLAAAKMPQDFIGQVVYLAEKYWPLLVFGMKNTLMISLCGTLFGFFGGMLLTSLRTVAINRRAFIGIRILQYILRFISAAYIEFIRGTPMMVQAMVIYYGGLTIGIHWPNPISAGILVVTLNTSAYMAEIIRAGIMGIDKGQYEGAKSLGMNDMQVMMHVILPQAIRNALPAIGNELVVNIKDTSVLNVISVVDLYFQASTIAGIHVVAFPAFTIASICYFVMTFTATRLLGLLEKKLNMPRGSYPHSQTTSRAVHGGKGGAQA